MIIPIEVHTSTATGRIAKFVTCENCQKDYVYFLERTVTGAATSLLFLEGEEATKRASKDAQRQLRKRLARVCDLVPCPRCGQYQDQMVRKARSQHRGKMFTPGLAGILLAAPLGIAAAVADIVTQRGGGDAAQTVSYVLIACAICAALTGVTLLLSRFRVVFDHFNPNDTPEGVRIEHGRERAMTAEEYMAMVERQRGSHGPSQSQQA